MAEEPEHLHLPSLQIIGARQVDGKWIANYRDKKNKSQVTKAFDTQQEAVRGSVIGIDVTPRVSF